MRKSIFVTALAGVLVWGGVASAGPLNPDLTVNPVTGDFSGADAQLCGGLSCIAGEGAAPNFQRGETVDGTFIGPAAVQHVDWIVIHDAAGVLVPASGGTVANHDDDYLYMYQMENSSVFTLNNFNIGAPSNPPNTFGFKAGTQGFLAGKNLDADADAPGGKGNCGVVIAAQCGANFPNLGDPAGPHTGDHPVNESEKTGAGAALVCCQDPSSVTVSSLFVNFGPPGTVFGPTAFLEVGEQSSIIFVRGTAPSYGDFVTSGASSGPGQTVVAWGSQVQTDCSLQAAQDNGGSCPAAFAHDEKGLKIPIPNVPEPGTILLLGSGLAGLGFWARRRKN